MIKKSIAATLCAAGFIFGNAPPGFAQDVLTTHRLSAALAAEAVTAKAGLDKISGRLK